MKLKMTYGSFLLMFFVMTSASVLGQQDWIHSQYSFSLYDVNAAAVGDGAQNALAFRYRQQWTGIDGAPSSVHASYQHPFASKSITWGTQLMNEEIGAHKSTSLQFTGAYRLKLNENSRLNFALEAGVINTVFDNNALNPEDVQDPLLAQFNQNDWSPQFNAALFWRNKKAILGVEANRLTQGKLLGESDSRQVLHLNAVAAYVFELKNRTLLKPSALVRHAGGQTQLEVQAAAFLFSSLWLGAGYRQDYGFLAMLEYQFSPRLRVGYSYDLANSLPGSLGATHEIFLGIQWAKKGNADPSIRYFQ